MTALLTLLHGDAMEKLRAMPEASVDSIVTDPPAGIEFMGKAWDAFVAKGSTSSGTQTPEWGQSEDNPYARGPTPRYRGKAGSSLLAFQDFLAEVLAEALRVLKPGGHALVWSLPRTSHHTGMAIERAGFEVRDCIHHVFGQGFPKSLNVSKALDAAAGAERKVVATFRTKSGGMESLNRTNAQVQGYRPDTYSKGQNVLDVTEPATEAARQWSGWGTALKPAVETWWLARKPMDEKTVAAQVLATGTGALNIDGSRVMMSGEVLRACQSEPANRKGEVGQNLGFSKQDTARFQQAQQDYIQRTNDLGRWPANLVLSHSPECRWVGTKTVENIGGTSSGGTALGQGSGWNTHNNRVTEINRTPDDVAVYDCAEGCPVAEMDRQSGRLSSGHHPSARGKGGISTSGHKGQDGLPEKSGDSGGASRYFHVFEGEAPFFYAPKASASDRSSGEGGPKNTHPTVKGQKLMRHLIKLVTPPQGVVLDPFMGSGSTIVAAVSLGFGAIGIEREADYFAIASARVQRALEERKP